MGFSLVLHQYIGECMVSIITINNGITEPTPGYQNVIPVKYWYLVGMSWGDNLLSTRVIIWVNTILHHIDTKAILPMYQGSCIIYIYLNGNETKMLSSTHVKYSLWIPKWYYKKFRKGQYQSNTVFHPKKDVYQEMKINTIISVQTPKDEKYSLDSNAVPIHIRFLRLHFFPEDFRSHVQKSAHHVFLVKASGRIPCWFPVVYCGFFKISHICRKPKVC